MRRNILTTIFIVGVVILLTGVVLSIRGARAMNVQINIRDLPEFGLYIVSPADPKFDGMVNSYFAGKSSVPAKALEPFSVFIRNDSKQAVVAYVVKWQLVGSDGRVITNITSYAQPGVLMGSDRSNVSLNTESQIIEPGSVQYLSWVAGAGTNANGSIGGIGGGSTDDGAAEQVQRTMQQRDESELVTQLTRELSKSTDLSVTIDGAFFEDGTFVGPNSTGCFEQMQAQVNAKFDLYREIATAVTERRNLNDVFAAVEAKSEAPDIAINYDTTPAQMYNFYSKLFAREILGMKAAYGQDRAALYVADLNRKPRPILQKRRSP